MQPRVAVFPRPFERGDEAAILGDVVGVDADAFVELCQDLALLIFDDGAVACGVPRRRRWR